MSRYVEIIRSDGGEEIGRYVQTEAEANVVLDEIADAEIGSEWKLKLIEMDDGEYAKLPEFMGY